MPQKPLGISSSCGSMMLLYSETVMAPMFQGMRVQVKHEPRVLSAQVSAGQMEGGQRVHRVSVSLGARQIGGESCTYGRTATCCGNAASSELQVLLCALKEAEDCVACHAATVRRQHHSLPVSRGLLASWRWMCLSQAMALELPCCWLVSWLKPWSQTGYLKTSVIPGAPSLALLHQVLGHQLAAVCRLVCDCAACRSCVKISEGMLSS